MPSARVSGTVNVVVSVVSLSNAASQSVFWSLAFVQAEISHCTNTSLPVGLDVSAVRLTVSPR